MTRSTIFMLTLVAWPLGAVEAPFDTLFFSPPQRAAIERAQPGSTRAQGVQPLIKKQPVINGLVKRSDGHTTVWVDGVAQTDRQNPALQHLQAADVGNPTSAIDVKDTSLSLVAVPVSVNDTHANPHPLKKRHGPTLLVDPDKRKKRSPRNEKKSADDPLQNGALRLLTEQRFDTPWSKPATSPPR